jgi:hypothetical protein
MEKIFANHVSDIAPVSRIYDNFQKATLEEQTLQLENGQ